MELPVNNDSYDINQPFIERLEQASDNSDEMMCFRSTLQFIFVTIPFLLLDGIQLLLYVLLLLPAFIQFGWFYFTCGRITRRYKHDSCRNTLDIYGHQISSTTDDIALLKPVILFCPGGAWLIGYKMWGALLAKAMIPFGILVVIIDYRNYPWATVPTMVQDVNDAIQWTLDHARDYGGDPAKLVLVGQSAGGHLCAAELFRKAIGLSRASGTFSPTTLAGFVSLSAPFNLTSMTITFARHGMSKSFTSRIFGGDMASYGPQGLVDKVDMPDLASKLPPIRVFHGTADRTVPFQGSVDFAATLRDAGIPVECVLYDGWSHTDPILEGVFDADHRFHRDLYELLQRWTEHEVPFDESHRACRRQCPWCLIALARWVNPF